MEEKFDVLNEQGEFIEEDPLLDCLENQISFIYNH